MLPAPERPGRFYSETLSDPFRPNTTVTGRGKSSEASRPVSKQGLLGELMQSRNLNVVESTMRDMDAFHERNGEKRGFLGSPRINLDQLLGIKK